MEELDQALALVHPIHATEEQLLNGAGILEITPQSFPLPTLGLKLRQLKEQIVNGRGFQVIKGVPVWRYSKWQCAAAFYGLGCYLGDAVSQNATGHLLGHVKDTGGDPSKPQTRLYTTSAAQPFHTDSCDIVGLMCLRPAIEGGMSTVTSSVTVQNELLRQAPHLAELLFRDFYNDRKGKNTVIADFSYSRLGTKYGELFSLFLTGEVPLGADPWFLMPVFNNCEGRLLSMYDRSFIDAAQKRFDELPRISPEQIEALDLADSLAASERLRLDMWLEPGDVQLIHNHVIWHARTAFTDAPDDPDRKRHLLRVWLSLSDGWPLPECFAGKAVVWISI